MRFKNISKSQIKDFVSSMNWNLNKCLIHPGEAIYIEVQFSKISDSENLGKFMRSFSNEVTSEYSSFETFWDSEALALTIKIS